MKCQLLDKRLNELMMMVLVRQTENCDMLLHMVMTDMKLLVVQIETADIPNDDVDNVSCSTDVERSKQPIETSIPVAAPKPASPKSASSGKRKIRKACFVFSAVVPKIKVTRPRLAHLIVTKSKSLIRRFITHSPSPKTSNLNPRVTVVQALVVSAAQGMQGKWGNPQHALKDKGVIDSGCSRHITGNMSYLYDFEELNGGYVSFEVFTAAGEELSAAKQKMMLLDSAAEGTLMLLSQVKTANDKCCCCDKSAEITKATWRTLLKKTTFLHTKLTLSVSMDLLNPQVVSAAKLSILNPNEFDLWKMRIVEGVVQPVGHTSIEQKLARRNELKARGTLLMDLPDKHQLKFNSHKDAKTLIEAIEKRFGGNTETKKRNKADLEEQSLDDLLNSLKIYETEVKHSSSTCKSTQNLAFVSSSNTDSTTDSVSAAASVFAVCAKVLVSFLPNVDSLSNAMAMLTMRARRKGHFARECRSPKDFRRNDATEPQRRTAPVETSTSNALVSQCDGIMSYDWSYQAEEEPANYALMAFTSSSSSSDNETNETNGLGYFSSESDCDSSPPSSLYDRLQPSGGYHAVPPLIIGTFMPPKPDLVFHTAPIAVKIKHLAFNVQLSPTKPEKDLSHTNRPTAPIVKDWVSDSEDESETKDPQIVPSFVQSSKQVKTPRTSVQPVETSIPTATPKPTSLKYNSSGKRRNRKTCFMCKSVDHLIKDCDHHSKKLDQPTPRNYAHRRNNKQNASLTHKNPQKHKVPAAVLTQPKLLSITPVRPVSADVPKIIVTRPRPAHSTVTKSESPIRRHITHSSSPKTSNSPPIVTVVQAPMVSAAQGNPQYALKDKGVIDSGCSRHMTGNMSYLSEFKELNGRYVTFGGNPKGGKIFSK
nr:hypothetical protein [Tanacetum cinerariifolium]